MLHLFMHEAGHAFAVHADFEKVEIGIFGTGNVDEHGMQTVGGHNLGFGRPEVVAEMAAWVEANRVNPRIQVEPETPGRQRWR